MGAPLTNSIQQVVETVWSTLLGLDVQRLPAPPASGADDAWAGTVRISGAWDGEVRVQCSPELAHRAAAIMFALDRTAISAAQAEDALRELANVTGGNLMEVLPGPCELSMPSVWSGSAAPRQPGSLMLSRVFFDCEGEPLAVVVLRTASAS